MDAKLKDEVLKNFCSIKDYFTINPDEVAKEFQMSVCEFQELCEEFEQRGFIELNYSDIAAHIYALSLGRQFLALGGFQNEEEIRLLTKENLRQENENLKFLYQNLCAQQEVLAKELEPLLESDPTLLERVTSWMANAMTIASFIVG